MVARLGAFTLVALGLVACAEPDQAAERPEPNCRVPVEPTVTVGVGVGSSGTRVGGGVVFDASGNNGILNEDGECELIETKSRVRVGIGF